MEENENENLTQSDVIAELQSKIEELQSENSKLKDSGASASEQIELENLRRENKGLKDQLVAKRQGFDNSMIA